MVNDAVLQSLAQSLQADPDNDDLRLHLASLLLQNGRASETLPLAQHVLARQPAHVEALKLAYWSADETGDPAKAAGYQQLLNALTGVQVARPGEHPALDPDGQYAYSSRDLNPSDANSARAAPPTPPANKARALRVQEPGDPRDASPFTEPHLPRVTFADVAGMQGVKQRLDRAFLTPMRHPELAQMYGKSLRGGLLMYGPPGCGKTFMARAVAGELGANFLAVGLADVLDMYIGQSERNLHAVFGEARRRAPCVLFLDEVDALGRKRSQMRNSLSNVVNQLLAELDGATESNEGVFVLTATNSPWDVDPALRRPGRLDRTVLVLPPDLEARRALLELHLDKRPNAGVDCAALAAQTEGYSGADLAHLVDSAAELAMEDAVRRGQARPVKPQDFSRALRDVKPSTGAWFDTARNVAQFANGDGTYDDLAAYLRARRLL
ncbi:ATPases of the AAA+ class [Deinococcus hopiensis KR-140]|uniref:ATPases of the AAA+ class n=2 Tax=Deinococcus TaxID=1298 RepID=A0A1W1VU16_9DEIO|nr:ATPases of the AAA+ class [Deinococcus hopiensis KR-140]